jgi:hypothetical protein
MIVFVAAAAAFSAPVPLRHPSEWFGEFTLHPDIDAPTLVTAEITVDPDGRPKLCVPKTVSGDPKWATFTCQVIIGEGRFKPARINTRPAYGVFRLRIAWNNPFTGASLPEDAPVWDYEVGLSPIPAGVKLPSVHKIQFVVDAAGHVQACDAAADWGDETLAKLACNELTKELAIGPAKTRAGQAVDSVQDATVRFVTAKTKASNSQ